MGGRQGTSLLERASSAVELARANPVTAMRMAQTVLGAGGLDPETEATALWAAGLADRELDALDSANARLGSAVAIAEASGLAAQAARIRLSLALVQVYQGRTDAALVEIERARPRLRGAEAGLCDVQHALIMTRLGRLDEALHDSLRALPLLRRAGDRRSEAVLLSNLGALRVYRGEFAEAAADLDAALPLARGLGHHLLVARTIHNAAFLHGRRGDIPRALALYDEAETAYRRLDDPDTNLAVLEADRAEVLLAAGLSDEARQRAEASLAALRRAENVTDQAEVLLLVARCRLAAGDRPGAFGAATAAAAALAGQGRRSWTALAEHVALEAADGADPGTVGRRAEAVAAELSLAGWRVEEQRAQLLAGRSHLAAGDDQAARRLLGLAAGRGERATVAERTLAWNAAALLAVAAGDRPGARRAVAAGLRVIEDHRATLGASELRAFASSAGVELAATGLRLALEDGRPREALRWVESLRAVSVLLPPVRPPDDDELADDLGRLRVAEAALRSAATPGAAVVHRAKVRALEAAVLRRTRRLAGEGPARRLELPEAVAALGDRVLLEYVVLDGRILGFVAVGGRVRMRPLGPLAAVEGELQSALFSLRRLSGDRVSEASLALAAETLDHALGALSEVLVAPFRRALGDRPAVIVPAGPIRAVPWSALPLLAGRPTSVAPSAAAWARAARGGRPGPTSLLAAGPELPGAEREIAELARLRPGAAVLLPPEATSAAVLDGLDVGTAHIAAHGAFRADNPLFSSLLLCDGPLTVYDLGTVRRMAPWVILSACDTAVSAAPGGDEILGLGGALLSLGVTTLVAPVAPVSDRGTAPLMVGLHRRLLAGDTPAEALAGLAERPPEDPAQRGAMVAFAAIGA